MKANVIYKGVRYDNVELGSIKTTIVSFRMHTNEPTYNEDIEQLVNDGADVDFYNEYAFIVVSRKDISGIIWL